MSFFFFVRQKTAYEILRWLEFRGVLVRSYKFGRDIPIELAVLSEGDPMLANPYGVIPINPQKHPHVKYDLADEFAQWLVSDKGQSVINSYRLLGKQLFYPDAKK